MFDDEVAIAEGWNVIDDFQEEDEDEDAPSSVSSDDEFATSWYELRQINFTRREKGSQRDEKWVEEVVLIDCEHPRTKKILRLFPMMRPMIKFDLCPLEEPPYQQRRMGTLEAMFAAIHT